MIDYANASLNKDLEVKSRIYAKASIQEYWVINLKRMELIVFRDPVEEEYRERRTFVEGVVNPLAFTTIGLEANQFSRRL